MRRIVHLSDLHFGCVPPGTCDAVRRAVLRLAPDLVIVSGDLTRRARGAVPVGGRLPGRTAAAAAVRARQPRRAAVRPVHPPAAAERALPALDRARGGSSLRRRHGGGGSPQHRAWLDRHGGTAGPCAALRVVFTHHPLDLPPDDGHPVPTRAQARLPEWIDRLSVDLFLAGHLHRSRALLGPFRARARRRAVFAQAGTATSDRHSGYGNAFNFIRAAADALLIEHWHADVPGTEFVARGGARFARAADGWQSA